MPENFFYEASPDLEEVIRINSSWNELSNKRKLEILDDLSKWIIQEQEKISQLS